MNKHAVAIAAQQLGKTTKSRELLLWRVRQQLAGGASQCGCVRPFAVIQLKKQGRRERICCRYVGAPLAGAGCPLDRKAPVGAEGDVGGVAKRYNEMQSR